MGGDEYYEVFARSVFHDTEDVRRREGIGE